MFIVTGSGKIVKAWQATPFFSFSKREKIDLSTKNKTVGQISTSDSFSASKRSSVT